MSRDLRYLRRGTRPKCRNLGDGIKWDRSWTAAKSDDEEHVLLKLIRESRYFAHLAWKVKGPAWQFRPRARPKPCRRAEAS